MRIPLEIHVNKNDIRIYMTNGMYVVITRETMEKNPTLQTIVQDSITHEVRRVQGQLNEIIGE